MTVRGTAGIPAPARTAIPRPVHQPAPTPPGAALKSRRTSSWLTALRYVGLWLLVAFFLMPVYVLLVTAFKDPGDVTVTGIFALPSSFSLDNFTDVWPKLSNSFRNSLSLSIPASLLSSLLGCANGFVLAKVRFRYANVVFPLILFGIFVPYQAIVIPLAQTMTDLGLRGGADRTGGLAGLTLIHIIYGLPITTLIFRNYFVGLPDSLMESARLDGAGVLQTFLDVAVPLARPAFAVSIIWQFTASWNDFMFGAMMTTRESWPITVALNNVAGGQSIPFGQAMAGALLASLPTLAIYLLLGRFFLRGVLAGTLRDN
ncbi:carbohydrate ABC transporter permease [Phytohabitans houttuyneae]|uniref:ABC transporter permease n=1 Tax=Phytohabitans houttuyneae TaxID=1076126 RepID=A0A6V8JWL8_9ACTN|nr:carbohydrate ABC transporter permease [Phytohabitans houttuyneae]GFJ77083.1 ABC transporter permease [Phytohabitans houttuyneae]